MGNQFRRHRRNAFRTQAEERRIAVREWRWRTADLCREWAVSQAGWAERGYVVVTVTAEHVRAGLPFVGRTRWCPLWEAFRAAGFSDVAVGEWTVRLDAVSARLPPLVRSVWSPKWFLCPVLPAVPPPGGWPPSVRTPDGGPVAEIPF